MTAPAEDATPRVTRKRRDRSRTLVSRLGDVVRRESRMVSAGVLLLAGVVFILLGWYGAAHTNILTEQIPYLISGGLLGLGLIIMSAVIASSAAAERDNRALREEIVSALSSIGHAQPVHATSTVAGDARVYAVPGGRSRHLAGCPILEGKDGVRELTVAQADQSGLAPCKLCGPD